MQIIRLLGNDKDRLQRELNEEKLQKEEAVRAAEIAQGRLQQLIDENANLQHMHDTDSAMIKRRNRQNEELKTDLSREKDASTYHKQEAHELLRQRDDAVEQCRRETTAAMEQAKQSSVHAEILKQNHDQVKAQYEKRFDALKEDMARLSVDFEQKSEKFAQHSVVVEQMAQQQDLNRQTLSTMSDENARLRKQLQEHEEHDVERIDKLMADNRAREAQHQQQLHDAVQRHESRVAEVEQQLGEAKYLINLFRAADGRRGPR